MQSSKLGPDYHQINQGFGRVTYHISYTNAIFSHGMHLIEVYPVDLFPRQ